MSATVVVVESSWREMEAMRLLAEFWKKKRVSSRDAMKDEKKNVRSAERC